LLVRWVEFGIYSSRFAINCFKTSPGNNNIGDVIEPWMYPKIIPLVRDIIRRRYALIPYIYSLALESHLTASPPQRWTGWGYENDPEVWASKILTDGETQYWFGDSLLVGGDGVFEPGETVARTYLPRQNDDDLGFLNLNKPFQHFEAGQWVKIDSPWKSSIPVLAKVGTGFPVGKSVQTVAPGDAKNPAQLPADDYRGVEIFPPPGSSNGRTFVFEWFEDDGIAAKPDISTFSISYSSSNSDVSVEFKHESGSFNPPWMGKVDIILPQGDDRVVVDASGKQAARVQGLEGREAFQLVI
jgi:alpha-glucosidase (family GH31 glycosyl hydrolase)